MWGTTNHLSHSNQARQWRPPPSRPPTRSMPPTRRRTTRLTSTTRSSAWTCPPTSPSSGWRGTPSPVRRSLWSSARTDPRMSVKMSQKPNARWEQQWAQVCPNKNVRLGKDLSFLSDYLTWSLDCVNRTVSSEHLICWWWTNGRGSDNSLIVQNPNALVSTTQANAWPSQSILWLTLLTVVADKFVLKF